MRQHYVLAKTDGTFMHTFALGTGKTLEMVAIGDDEVVIPVSNDLEALRNETGADEEIDFPASVDVEAASIVIGTRPLDVVDP